MSSEPCMTAPLFAEWNGLEISTCTKWRTVSASCKAWGGRSLTVPANVTSTAAKWSNISCCEKTNPPCFSGAVS